MQKKKKLKPLSKAKYEQELMFLAKCFDTELALKEITEDEAYDIRDYAEDRAARDPDYDKWEDKTTKLCLDWWLANDYLKQFRQAPNSWSETEKLRAWRMAVWNPDIRKRYLKKNRHADALKSDII